ncbi:MAG: TetR/AcrR family transcriptional regulator [Ruminococcaceae bacterium]|nr:TetR/AcrR family transcriptional regulator [Oscillospiraceae bacterium]
MKKGKYHHGFLEKDLIEKGLQLLNSVGLEAFSLRKVAEMCGVSHTAPYRHFKNKEELIYAITTSVSDEFTLLINGALAENEGDYRKQILAVSKLYVKFMVENPEHFKFIFMTDHHNPIIIKKGEFIKTDRWIVSVLENLFIGLRKNEGISETNWSLDALTIWSLIHGFTTMLVNNTIKYEGDYLDAVTLMLEEKVKI